MLNVGKIENGIVLDHIEAGKAMLIYHYLHLDREDYQVAIIKNARSNDMGRKDILKVECDPDTISLDAVALIEPNTTVNIIKGGVIVITNGVRVFVPASLATASRGDSLDDLVKTKVRLRIIDVNRQRKRAVGSIRSVLKDERKAKEEAFWAQAEETGRVAGANAAGDNVTYEPIGSALVMHAFGTAVFSLGTNGKGPDGKKDPKYRCESEIDRDAGTYRACYYDGTKMAGAILVGDISAMPDLTKEIGV